MCLAIAVPDAQVIADSAVVMADSANAKRTNLYAVVSKLD
eukprot:COSAG02_NODE_15994_length_1122_cov_1.321603_2_plen_39_part_01